jgi:hypothetical protein
MTRTGSHGRTLRPGSIARGFLVAALALAACGAPPGGGAPPPTTPLKGVSPTGDVSLPVTFTWQGNTADGIVRVSIEDRAQRPVFAFSARGSSSTPEGLDQVLTPGEPFTWTVAAVDGDGHETRRSLPLTFARITQEVRD